MELNNDLYIITEYMEKGSLKDLLKKEPNLFKWQLILRMSIDIAQVNFFKIYIYFYKNRE